MSGIDAALIKRKIEHILSYLEELKPIAKISFEEFVGDKRNFRTAERDLQLIVDTAVDINNHLVVASGSLPPNDYFESFIKLSNLQIFPKQFAERIAQSAGLRNRLVHEYEEIDLSRLFEDLENDIRDYQEYCEYIIKYIK
ncbi:MAG TPA: DUF86 domain-containing protein [Patescibacteria group bacterium]|nr:DUF86 domain-containing protein [Patescibacteria group bacterium]